MDIITSLFTVYRYDNTVETFTVPPGGDGYYYFSVYCFQIRQHHWNIHSAPWWRWILLLLCLLFTDTTTPLEHSQCPLVEMDIITFRSTFSCGFMSMLTLTSKSIVKRSAQLGRILTLLITPIPVTLHAAQLLLQLKVKS